MPAAFAVERMSGIHRGMGTHISKVKSIDLDTWTPEQMEVRPRPLTRALDSTRPRLHRVRACPPSI